MEKEKFIIAERIKNLRKEKGYTQEQLAEILGLASKSSIANYESGANSPSDDSKLKMCEIYDCTLDYLMGKSDIRKPESETKLEDICMHLAKEAQDLNLDKEDVNYGINEYKKFEEFEKIAKPVSEFIRKNYDMHTTAIITDSFAKVVRDDIGVPIVLNKD